MKRIREIIKIIDIIQLLDFILFPFIWLFSLLFKPFLKDVWIIEENPNEACDNGYILFKYIKEKTKGINVYYVINKKSKDLNKVRLVGNVIYHKSLKHWIYYLNANKIIVTQKYANPSPALFHVFHKLFMKNKRIFLQHGIIKDDCKMYYYSRCKFRLFICGAKREYEYIKNNYNYPNGYVAYTGLARYDNLNLDKKINNLILIYPTWRNYINNQKDFEIFMNKYSEIINNKNLINFIEKNNITIQLVLHKNMKKFNINKNTLSKNIIINHNEDVDIQNLINKTDLLITDFSSIFFDIAYRQKPVIYYQFDVDVYRKNQLDEGYFSYIEDGFGDVFNNSELVIDKIKYYINNNYKIEDKYLRRMNSFFERKDKENSKRILEEIKKIK